MLDATDRKILSILVEDAKAKVSDIAAACEVSRQTVAARIKRLEASGVIKGYRAVIDYSKIELNQFFILFLKLGSFEKPLLEQALKEFMESPFVLLDASITGEWDVVQILGFPTTSAYDDFLSKLRTKYGRVFRDTKSHAVLRFFKTPDDHRPLSNL